MEKEETGLQTCRLCAHINTLDQWYEMPDTPYLVCSVCASTNPRARPIHINTLAKRLLEAYEVLQELKQQNEELSSLAEGDSGIEKQIRRLVQAMERQTQTTEQMSNNLAELTKNILPRRMLHVEQDQRDAVRRLVRKLSVQAPGEILEVTEEEHQLLQGMVKL